MGRPDRYPLGSPKHAYKARAIGELARPTAHKALGGRTMALRELILNWPLAVGRELAAGTRPEKLSRARAGEACLTLAVDPSRALFVQHDAQRYVERVNAYVGYALIKSLRIVQRTVRIEARSDGVDKTAAVLDPAESRGIAAKLSRIDDEETRAILQEMGELIAARAPRRP